MPYWRRIRSPNGWISNIKCFHVESGRYLLILSNTGRRRTICKGSRGTFWRLTHSKRGIDIIIYVVFGGNTRKTLRKRCSLSDSLNFTRSSKVHWRTTMSIWYRSYRSCPERAWFPIRICWISGWRWEYVYVASVIWCTLIFPKWFCWISLRFVHVFMWCISCIFSVDYLLPVQVDGNWIGVVYRDGQCIMTLMDHYDITNKAIQCDPSFDIRSMDWFTNNYNRFRIIPDIPRKMRKSKKGRFTKYIRTSTLSENGFNSHSELLQQDVVSDSEDTPTSPSHSAMSSSWKDQETHVGPIAVSIDSVVKVPAQIISSPPTPILPPSAIALPVPPVPVLQPQNGKMQIHTHCPCRFCQSKQQWIQWMDRTIQAAVSEANYFMDIRRQYIGCWVSTMDRSTLPLCSSWCNFWIQIVQHLLHWEYYVILYKAFPNGL